MTRIFALVCAAGSSTRFNTNSGSSREPSCTPKNSKVFLDLYGQSILKRSVSALISATELEFLVVLARAEDRDRAKEELSHLNSVEIVEGGGTRQESVFSGIQFLCNKFEIRETDLILVHDAARCIVDPEDIRQVIEVAKNTGAATLGRPITDSLVRVNWNSDGAYTKQDSEALSFYPVLEHLKRNEYIGVQTPQVFNANLLINAHEEALGRNLDFTDDASMVGMISKVFVVLAQKPNIKITFESDLLVAEALLLGSEKVKSLK